MITLYKGDCVEILRDIAAGCVHAVITDPPYSINTKSDGQGKLSPLAVAEQSTSEKERER